MKRVMFWGALILAALAWALAGYDPPRVNEVTGDTVYCDAGEWLNEEGTGCEPMEEGEW